MEDEQIRIAALNAAIAIGFDLNTTISTADERGKETTYQSGTATAVLRVMDVADAIAEWIRTGETPDIENLF